MAGRLLPWAAAILLWLPSAHGALGHAHAACDPNRITACGVDAADAQLGALPPGPCPLCLASSQGRTLPSPDARGLLPAGPSAALGLPAARPRSAPRVRGVRAPRAPPASS